MSWLTRSALALAAGSVAITSLFLSPPPATALQAAAHGAGFTSPDDGRTWLGSYRLDDGAVGLCLQIELPEPHDDVFEYTDASGWFAEDDRARLAYIAREWAGVDDPEFAAAAQIATWRITGFESKSVEKVARVAGAHAGRVLEIADRMTETIAGAASRGARATVDLVLPSESGPGSVRADLEVDLVASGWSPAALSAHRGLLTLQGAHFADGTSSKTIANGVDYALSVPPGEAVLTVTATVSFSDLPYGSGIDVAKSPSVQSLLIARPGRAHAGAETKKSGPAAAPFQPRVQTETSSQEAAAGAEIFDTLELSVDASPTTLGEWGLYQEGDELHPVPVVIRSTLLGPFTNPITPADDVPADAPRVCDVHVNATRGPGTYQTPSCTLPSPGYYVWVDSIDPADTPADKGGAQVRPWRSRFGVASEVTFSPTPPKITTTVSSARASVDECLSDTLHVSGLSSTATVRIESILIGPLATQPRPGTVFASLDGLPIAGRATVEIAADGDHRSECFPVTMPGHYVFVYRSAQPPAPAALAALTSAAPVVPAVADLTVYESESAVVRPKALAATGGEGTKSGVHTTISLAGGSIIATGVLLSLVRSTRRRRS